MVNIPDKVNKVLSTYFDQVNEQLPSFLDGYYLFGSSSLEAFQEHNSDIDFIAVVKKEVQESELHFLKEIHQEIHKQFPDAILDGLYVQHENLTAKPSNTLCLRFNDGEFQGFQKFDPNSIDAYQLKKYGITIKGKRIQEYDFEVDWDVLLKNMQENLNSYWVKWMNGSRNVSSEDVRLEDIEWGVLGVTRLYFTFMEQDITSKVGAGEYALKHVPERWHRIIHEAMRLRKNNHISQYRSHIERYQDALDYLDFMIRECNKI